MLQNNIIAPLGKTKWVIAEGYIPKGSTCL